MEKYNYKPDNSGQIIVLVIGVLIVAFSPVMAGMVTGWTIGTLGIMLFPGFVGVAMIMYGMGFDNDSFLVKNGFSPSMFLERSCPFWYGVASCAYDKELSLLCVARMEHIRRYEVLYYPSEEIDVMIDVDYTLVTIRKRENISGFEAGFAFFLGGLPFAVAATVMGKLKEKGEVKAIRKITLRVIPHTGSEKELSTCLFVGDEDEKYEKGKTESISGLRYLEKAKELQDAVAEGQAAAGESCRLSTAINWNSLDWDEEKVPE